MILCQCGETSAIECVGDKSETLLYTIHIHFQYVYLSNAFQYHIIYFMEKVVHSCYKRETCLVQNASCMMSRELTDSRFFISVFCKCDNLCNI